MGMSLVFTDTAKQIPIPQDPDLHAEMWEDWDYHIFNHDQMKNFPHAYTSVDPSLLDVDGEGVFYAPVNHSLGKISLPYGTWGVFRDEMAQFFAEGTLHWVRANSDALRGRTLFYHLMDFSDHEGVLDPYAIRALANDIRSAEKIMARRDHTKGYEFWSMLRDKDPMLSQTWSTLQDNILATARVGGIAAIY